MEGYTNSDMSADVDTSRSTTGYVMTYAGGVVSWQSRLQKAVALSTMEAEYMSAVEADKEIIWMKEFIGELGIRQDEFQLCCDNQSVIHLAKNASYHSRTKHIQRRYHLAPRASRRKEICCDEDSHGRKWIGHVDKGVVSREVERVPTKGRTGAISHVGVKGEFVRKHVPPDGKEISRRFE